MYVHMVKFDINLYTWYECQTVYLCIYLGSRVKMLILDIFDLHFMLQWLKFCVEHHFSGTINVMNAIFKFFIPLGEYSSDEQVFDQFDLFLIFHWLCLSFAFWLNFSGTTNVILYSTCIFILGSTVQMVFRLVKQAAVSASLLF